MNLRILALAAVAVPLLGCDVELVQRYPRRGAVMVVEPAPVMVAQPAPPPIMVVQPAPPPVVMVAPPPPPPPPAVMVVQPAPVVVEEGAVVGGVVVVEPAAADYVLIGGEWYFWHPGFRAWVHAHRGRGWRPRGEFHEYHGWGEHPMYRR